jgi:hypothetical protein
MWLIIIVVVSVCLNAILGYLCYNASIYIEKVEEILDYYKSTLIDLRDEFIETETRLREIDLRGAFESDDEVGVIFKNIKEMTLDLSEDIENAHEMFTN